MKVFVTGATGGLGSKLVLDLLSAGHEVISLSRQAGRAPQGSREVVGSLEHIPEWEAELRGCDTLVHCAAKVEFWGPWEEFYSNITQASIALLDACERQGVRRFVYISSESVLQDRADLVNIDEAHPYPAEPSSYYGKAKMLAEQAILQHRGRVERIILRPSFIYGAGGTEKFLTDQVHHGLFVWVNRGQTPIEMVYVWNVIEAIRCALTQGKDGGVYYVTDQETMDAKTFLTGLLATHEVEIKAPSLPAWLLAPVASVTEKLWRAFSIKTPPPLSRFTLSFLAMGRRYSTQRARTELGYQPRYTTAEAFARLTAETQH